MKTFLKILSYTGLALTLLPAFLVFQGLISLELNKTLMLIGTICWFLTAPSWMNKSADEEALEEENQLKT